MADQTAGGAIPAPLTVVRKEAGVGRRRLIKHSLVGVTVVGERRTFEKCGHAVHCDRFGQYLARDDPAVAELCIELLGWVNRAKVNDDVHPIQGPFGDETGRRCPRPFVGCFGFASHEAEHIMTCGTQHGRQGGP